MEAGHSANQDFALSSYEWRDGETGAMEWRVLGEENGQILITTEDPIQNSASADLTFMRRKLICKFYK